MPANPYSAPPFSMDSDYLRRLAAAMRGGFGATARAAQRMPNMGPMTAPFNALGAMAPPPQVQQAQAQAAPVTPPPAPFAQPPAQPPVQPQPTISSSVVAPLPGRGAGEYQYGSLTEGAEPPPQVAGVAAGGGGSMRDNAPDEGMENLQSYWANLNRAGPAERKAAEMRLLAQSMRGRGTGKLDWGSQLAEAIRGGVEGYGISQGMKSSADYEKKIGTATDEYMRLLEELRRRRRGNLGPEQLSGPGME